MITCHNHKKKSHTVCPHHILLFSVFFLFIILIFFLFFMHHHRHQHILHTKKTHPPFSPKLWSEEWVNQMTQWMKERRKDEKWRRIGMRGKEKRCKRWENIRWGKKRREEERERERLMYFRRRKTRRFIKKRSIPDKTKIIVVYTIYCNHSCMMFSGINSFYLLLGDDEDDPTPTPLGLLETSMGKSEQCHILNMGYEVYP